MIGVRCPTKTLQSGCVNVPATKYNHEEVMAWKNEPAFTLRGFKSCTRIDWHYVLLPDLTYNDNVFFLGFGRNFDVLCSSSYFSYLRFLGTYSVAM